MNPIRLLLTAVLVLSGPSCLNAKTPKWFKNASNSTVQVVTYKNGTEIGRSTGFFTSAEGTCVSDYMIFVGADSAVTVSRDGRIRPVTLISGASSMYETIRFNAVPDKKLKNVSVTHVRALENTTASIVPFQGKGKTGPIQASIAAVSAIDSDCSYYKLDIPYDSLFKGCPVIDEDGSCIGIVQAGSNGDKFTYVLDANYPILLSPSAADLLDRCYTDIRIRHTLPLDEDQALAYVYIRNDISSEEYKRLLDQFMEQFPDSPDGLFNYGAFILSEQSMESGIDAAAISKGEEYIMKAIEKSDDKGRFYCDYASLLIENIKLSGNSSEDSQPIMEKALGEVEKAIEIKNEPAYVRLKANILYSMKRYSDAYDCADMINKSDIASAETYLFAYEISRKLDNLDLSIELLDSVIAKSPKPISQKAVALILERGNLKDDAGRYREAVQDYMAFESATIGSLPARYYLAREQIEIKARMYEPALADIARARELEPENLDFALEHASLHLRVGQAENALEILKELVVKLPDDPDVQRLAGISYLRVGDKENACEHLSLARMLGDELVEQIIEQNCK